MCLGVIQATELWSLTQTSILCSMLNSASSLCYANAIYSKITLFSLFQNSAIAKSVITDISIYKYIIY